MYECRGCHHKWDGKTQIASCATSGCHDLFTSPKKPTKYLAYTNTGIKYLKYAFHQNCVGRHNAIKDKRKKMGLLGRFLPNDTVGFPFPPGCVPEEIFYASA
ncbi:MAG: cytochrome c3 family protein [Thermodesulfobacteriota bacterium]|nr:cytochrome c3 family protein [Thermodesulfobacteriota bacterium]